MFFSLKDELNFLDSSSPNKEFLLLQGSLFLSSVLLPLVLLLQPVPDLFLRCCLFYFILFSFHSWFARIFLWLFLYCCLFPFSLIFLSCVRPSSDPKPLIWDCLVRLENKPNSWGQGQVGCPCAVLPSIVTEHIAAGMGKRNAHCNLHVSDLRPSYKCRTSCFWTLCSSHQHMTLKVREFTFRPCFLSS